MRSNYASEYGLAIFKLADETGAQKEIFEDFTAVRDVLCGNVELMKLLSNPRLSRAERAEVVENIFGGRINRYLLNALKILAEKRHCGMVDKCWLEYRNRYCEANNILAVSVVSAVEMSQSQKKRLIDTLAKNTGSSILLSCKVDKSCIGGIRLEYGGKRYDASVRQKLESLKRSLTSGY